MTNSQLEKVQQFFETAPRLEHTFTVPNPNTGVESEYTLRSTEFSDALFHNSLEGYYKTNFALMQHHKYSLSEIENMNPFERQVYVSLLMQYLEQVKQQQEAAQR